MEWYLIIMANFICIIIGVILGAILFRKEDKGYFSEYQQNIRINNIKTGAHQPNKDNTGAPPLGDKTNYIS